MTGGVDIFHELMPFVWRDQPPLLPGFDGARAISGRRGSVVFIATEDHDGQLEVSLATFDPEKRPGKPPKPCSMAQAKWFFEKLGVHPVEAVRSARTRHFVLRRGIVQ